jgi:hypothetical protein
MLNCYRINCQRATPMNRGGSEKRKTPCGSMRRFLNTGLKLTKDWWILPNFDFHVHIDEFKEVCIVILEKR